MSNDGTKAILIVLTVMVGLGLIIGVTKVKESDCKEYLVGNIYAHFQTHHPRCDDPLPLWFLQWVQGQGG